MAARIKPEKEKKMDFDGRIWPKILDTQIYIDSQLTTKANILFGAATLFIVFFLNKIISSEYVRMEPSLKLVLILIVITGFIASLLSISIVLPRVRFFIKRARLKEDVFYFKNITKCYTREEYFEYLKDLPKDNERIARAYSAQIYSFANDVLLPKSKMLKVAGFTLILTMLMAILFFIYYLMTV
jgi:hypothetical protein